MKTSSWIGGIGATVITAVIAVAGAQSEVAVMTETAGGVCADVLRSGLKQPSSFELQNSYVSAKEMPLEEALARIQSDDPEFEAALRGYAKTDYAEGKPLWIVDVSLDYSALNSFGGAARDAAFCRFVSTFSESWQLERFGANDKMYEGVDLLIEGGFKSDRLNSVTFYDTTFLDRLRAVFGSDG